MDNLPKRWKHCVDLGIFNLMDLKSDADEYVYGTFIKERGFDEPVSYIKNNDQRTYLMSEMFPTKL